MNQCDLHNLSFEEGRDKIINTMNTCIVQSDPIVEIIHGYHGHVFRDYIYSQEFRKDLEDEGIFIKNMKKTNPGSTEISLDL